MKKPILPIILASLLLIILSCGSMAAPVLPAGRPKEIASFRAHPSDIETLAFSPDGKILASGSGDGKLKLWAMPNGENIADIQAYKPTKRAHGMLRGLAFSPDGKTVVTCDDDGNAKRWDVATGNNTDTLDARLLAPLRFSPDGATLVSRYELFDLKAKKTAPLIRKFTGYMVTPVFEPKGKLLVATASQWPDPPWVVALCAA